MIKLIASDIDGTLLRHSGHPLPPRVFRIIRELMARGITFAAASGRQYGNIKRLFAPVWQDIYFIPDNGAMTLYRDDCLYKAVIPRELAMALVEDIHQLPGCEVQLGSAQICYVHPRNRAYTDYLVYTMRNTVAVVEDFASVADEFVKISAFIPQGDAGSMLSYFQERWGEKLRVALAGDRWVDCGLSDKGAALTALQNRLGIAPEETMAFGDNLNDLTMLRAVGHPYCMENAHPLLLEEFPRCAEVEAVLETLLREQPVPV